MSLTAWRAWLYDLLWWVHGAALAAIFLVAGALFFGYELPDWMNLGEKSPNNNSGAVIAFLSVFSVVVWEWRRRVGKSWLHNAISRIVDNFQKDIYGGRGESEDHHRVTLYRFKQRHWFPGRQYILHPFKCGYGPWSGWLVPVVRSGLRGRGKTVFLAKSGLKHEHDGVVGAAFSRSDTLQLSGLPDISETASTEDVSDYAKRTFVDPEFVRNRLKQHRPLARYFLAIRVEVKQERWGVLMIDSRDDSLLEPRKTQNKFAVLHSNLSVLIERI